MIKLRKYSNLVIVLIIILIAVFVIFKNQEKFQKYLKLNFSKLPNSIKTIIFISSGKRNYFNLQNDYNVKFLPKTQFVDLNFYKKQIKTEPDDIIKYGSGGYLEVFESDIYYISKNGKFYKTDIDSLDNDKKELEHSVLNINYDFGEILDTLVVNDIIYVSNVKRLDNCLVLEIQFSKITNNLDFEIFKKFDECGTGYLRGGRLQEYILKGKKGILITTSDLLKDLPDNRPQDEKSIYGKTIFIDYETKKHEIFSKGHRNAQGLFVLGDKVFSTEHGPKGGDEINNLIYNGNYGWPNASYGVSYSNKRDYLKSHEKNGFEEPIYVFVPSVGISEIIILPNSFHKKWQNNAIVTSLADKSIYRVKFKNEEFNEILYVEKIFIDDLIRDIKYIKYNNSIILALKNNGTIGVLKTIN
tara:strand:- start:1148 stop:2389 length:1242 start_codon:yes stop_codon:yes gene_type:complete